MEEEKMLVPSGLKTVDGKDIMCYTGAFYLKNEEKIKRINELFHKSKAEGLTKSEKKEQELLRRMIHIFSADRIKSVKKSKMSLSLFLMYIMTLDLKSIHSVFLSEILTTRTSTLDMTIFG